MFANPIQMLMSDDLPKSLPLTCLNLNSVRNRVRFSWTHCKWFLCRFSYVRTRRKWETSRNQQQQFKHAVGPHTVSYREGERARDLVGRAGILAMNKFTGMLQCGTTQEQREAKKKPTPSSKYRERFEPPPEWHGIGRWKGSTLDRMPTVISSEMLL